MVEKINTENVWGFNSEYCISCGDFSNLNGCVSGLLDDISSLRGCGSRIFGPSYIISLFTNNLDEIQKLIKKKRY